MFPRRSVTTHTEQRGDEASTCDWARAQVHALNPSAAFVWRWCDGARRSLHLARQVSCMSKASTPATVR
jgi:hypothetical protein